MMLKSWLQLLYLLSCPSRISSFATMQKQRCFSPTLTTKHNDLQNRQSLYEPITKLQASESDESQTTSVYIDSTLTDDRVRSLFAWVSRAFSGDEEYNNLMYAMAAVFGTNLPPDSAPILMAKAAEELLPTSDEALTGEVIPIREREQASLGAMGAGQWMGAWKTRPHSMLDVSSGSNITSVEDWVKTLPRGCRRTLKKANAQNFTVTTRPIRGSEPAPHSSLAHFRCVVEHEVRLITQDENDTEGFLQALSMSVGRYIETTQMTGVIQEYRNAEGRIIAFAHEVRKGRAIRGQWFYASDEAAKSYVWFHSVQELVRRAIEADGVDTADLGPSGSDAFSELKAKYGFEAVDDWPAVADYTGPFWYEDQTEMEDIDDKDKMVMELLRLLQD